MLGDFFKAFGYSPVLKLSIIPLVKHVVQPCAFEFSVIGHCLFKREEVENKAANDSDE